MKIGYFGLLFLCFLICDLLTSSLVVGKQKICFLKPETGPCKGKFIRYYYDPRSNECETFVYGGCGGNENNFETQKECDKMCKRRLASNIKDTTQESQKKEKKINQV